MKKAVVYTIIYTALSLLTGCAEEVPEKRDITVISTSAQTEEIDTVTEKETVSGTEETKAASFTVIELDTISSETEETVSEPVIPEDDIPEIIQTEDTQTSRYEKQYDIDLTELGSTMLYAQVCNMIYEPTDYIGKSVKIRAPFTVAEENGQRYYSLLIYDNTACCVQGIEFDLGDAYKYPDDYPEIGEEITVGGVFGSYQEGIATYYKLYGAVRIE